MEDEDKPTFLQIFAYKGPLAKKEFFWNRRAIV